MLDFHTHTTASDGYLTPLELLRAADRIGLTHLAITDHDTTAGLRQIASCLDQFKVKVIPGIEISANHSPSGISVHVLGYGVGSDDPALEASLSTLRERRNVFAREILGKLRGSLYDLTWEEVQEVAAQATAVFKLHIIQALWRKGLVESWNGAAALYEHLFGPAGIARVSERYLDAREAVGMVLDAGGIPVLAHPGVKNAITVVDDLIDAGLMGIETYYPDHGKEMTQLSLEIARTRGLLVTGGTDFHGSNSLIYARRLPCLGETNSPDSAFAGFLRGVEGLI